jgi:PAS domain S-box-containing protein
VRCHGFNLLGIPSIKSWEMAGPKAYPEDLQRCVETYTTAFDKREPFKMEYRLRRHDGEYRWVYDVGVPRFNTDGAFVGYIGSCTDTT